MRRGLILAVVALISASGLKAQEVPTKVAFVDIQRALLSIEEGKAKRKEMQDWAAPRQQELQRLEQEIQAMQQDLARKESSLSPDQLAVASRQLTAKKREFEDKQRQYARELEERQNQVLKGLGEKMEKLLAEYASKEKFAAVFILQPNLVAFVANSVDITETLVKLYNEKYPGAAKGAGN